jgi:hypothetical protein
VPRVDLGIGWSEDDLCAANILAPTRRNSPAKLERVIANTIDLQWPDVFVRGDNVVRRERPQATMSINAGTMTCMA